MFQLLITLLFIVNTYNNQCVSLLATRGVVNQLVPKLQTGSISLERNQQSVERFHYYTVALTSQFKHTFEVALSIIYIQNYCPEHIDFSVRAIINSTKTLTAVLTISEQSLWQICHVHYLVSNRSDFRAGYFTPEDDRLLWFNKTSNKGSFEIQHSVKDKDYDPIFLTNNIRFSIFLSGIRTQDSSFFLEVRSGSPFEQDKKIISVRINANFLEYPLENLHLYFVLYMDEKSFETQFISDVQSHVKNIVNKNNEVLEDLTFSGMTGINTTENKYTKCSKNRLLIQELQTNQLDINQFFGSFNIEGIKIKDKVAESLSFDGYLTLAPQLQQFISSNACIYRKQCEQNGGKVIKLQNSTSVCAVCNQDQFYNYQMEKCVCFENKYLSQDGKKCLTEEEKCGKQGIFRDGSCFQCSNSYCEEPYVFSNSLRRCVCSQNMGYESVRINNIQQCLKKCTTRSERNQNGECVCRFKSQYIDKETGECIPCPRGKSWSSSQNRCTCRFPQKERFDNTCVYCSVNGFFDDVKRDCFCKQGYQGTGLTCKKKIQKQQQITVLGSGIIVLDENN